MNNLKAMLAIGLSLTTSALADEATEKVRKIDSLYKSGLTAMKQGKAAEATNAFKSVLKLNPRHGHARYQLARVGSVTAQVQLAQRKASFTKINLEKVHFTDATLAEALEAVNELTLKASDKKFSPNFVIQDPKETLKDRKVSLQMNNAPLSAILTYILDGVGATARYDAHATVIRPTGK